jgi:hypothetical protein
VRQRETERERQRERERDRERERTQTNPHRKLKTVFSHLDDNCLEVDRQSVSEAQTRIRDQRKRVERE